MCRYGTYSYTHSDIDENHSVFADSRQTNVRCLPPVGGEKQGTAFTGDNVLLNTSLSRALMPKTVQNVKRLHMFEVLL